MDHVVAALSSGARINCPWCCRFLACSSLYSDARSVACTFAFLGRAFLLVSGSLCWISLTSSVGLYIGIRIFVPDLSHFQRWSIHWYQDLCARYLSLPALVYILVSGSLCQISLTPSVGLYIGIRVFVPDLSHFQRWSIYWCKIYLPRLQLLKLKLVILFDAWTLFSCLTTAKP